MDFIAGRRTPDHLFNIEPAVPVRIAVVPYVAASPPAFQALTAAPRSAVPGWPTLNSKVMIPPGPPYPAAARMALSLGSRLLGLSSEKARASPT